MNTLKYVSSAVREFIHDETGQDLVEYGLIVGLIALAAIVSMSGLSTKLKSALNSLGNGVTNSV